MRNHRRPQWARDAEKKINRRNNRPRTEPTETLMRAATGRRGSVSYAGAGDRGYADAWAASPYFKNGVTVDSRWSR